MKVHVTNSSGHLSKLCQVFHLMICVMLGVFFFALFIWHFLSKLCMVLRWQCSPEESLPYQEPLRHLAKRGFSLLGTVCDFLLSSSF